MRLRASGSVSLAHVEAIFDEELASINGTSYSPWLDHHLALYAPSRTGLPARTSAFQELIEFTRSLLALCIEQIGGRTNRQIY